MPLHVLLRTGLNRALRALVTQYSLANRYRKAKLVSDWMAEIGGRSLLLVGYSPSITGLPNINIVEDAVAFDRTPVVAINIVSVRTPLSFGQADVRALPFRSCTFDFALANAVIEHVGDRSGQERMVAEMTRVARAWAITTPNRYFPIEPHTATIFLHWSARWRARRKEFDRLLTRREFISLLPADVLIIGHFWSPTLTALWTSPSPALDKTSEVSGLSE